MAKKKARRKEKKKAASAKTNPLSKKKSSPKSRTRMPALAAMKASGATAIEVHFQGYGDDGCYDCRAKAGSKDLEMTEAAREEVEQFLNRHFKPAGEAFGSILLGHFDLLKSTCKTLSGEGLSRAEELIDVLDSYGVANLVGVVQGSTFKQCRVLPESAMSREDACSYVNRFLFIQLDVAREYDFYAEELKTWKGQWRVDVKSRKITIQQSNKHRAIEIRRLTAKKLPLLL